VTLVLCNIENCTGCGACVNICSKDCIKLQSDKSGFLLPHINEKECICCGRCDAVCPMLHPIERENFSIPVCYAGWNKDAKVRRNSTSGGVFSALAEYVISMGGIVCGVILDDELRPYHTVATSLDEIETMRGSKYLQSDTRSIFRQVKEALLSDKYVLFSGCPCQVVGLYAFLANKKYQKLITCEVVCHGVASVAVFDWYKAYLEKRADSLIVDVNFRSKKYGWTNSASSFLYVNGTMKTIKARDSLFMRAFYASLCVRKSCVKCSYASLPRVADITIGDYWRSVVQNYPKRERQQGISLILENNEKATIFISALRDKIFCKPITLQDVTMGNTNISSLGKANLKRNEFLSEYEYSDVRDMMTKYFPITLKSRVSAIIGRRWIYKIKSVVNKIKDMNFYVAARRNSN